jgi:predicted transcriptional regulator
MLMPPDALSNVAEMTAEVVAAYVANNKVAPSDLADLIASVFGALSRTGQPAVEPVEAAATVRKLTPGQIRKSITPDALISFEDGKGYKMLKRHLSTQGLTFADYRAKWGLPRDYPSTAPAYSAARSELAKSIGLGRKSGNAVAAGAKGKVGRPKKSGA